MIRKIIHIDMDAFYASIEQLDNPQYKGKPIAVGGDGRRGVVAAASYEARKYGVRSAMPTLTAKKLCKHIILVKPRFNRYKEISSIIKNIYHDYTDIIEPLSLDEAFLDVTVNKKKIKIAENIAREIRRKIKRNIGLTASAGISMNKFLAKVATEINKPNGQKTIHPSQVDKFIDSLQIERFFGVGKVTAANMRKLNIHTGKDLKNHNLEFLKQHFGKSGEYFYRIAHNLYDNPVNPNRVRKSIGAERTFFDDIRNDSFIVDKLNIIATKLEERIKKSKVKGKTITVKIKYNDFTKETRSITSKEFIQTKSEFFPLVEELVYKKSLKNPVRLLGISISNLNNINEVLKPKSVQISLKL